MADEDLVASRASAPAPIKYIPDFALRSEDALGGALEADQYCSEKGWFFDEITHLDGELPFKDHVGRQFRHSREWIACMKDVRVISEGFLVTGEGVITRGLTHCNISVTIHGRLFEAYPEIIHSSAEIPEAILCWGTDNFGHWLWEFLARMTLLKKGLSIPVLLNEKTPPRFYEWIVAMGFENLVIAGDWVKVKKLWVPSVVNYRGHYENNECYVSVKSILALRSRLARIGRPRRKLYFSRAQDAWRRIVNEPEVIENLPGFEVIDTERIAGMSMEDQLELVGEAHTIVMPCGGASPITMFAPENCKIIELNNNLLHADFGSAAWAGILGQKFCRIDGPPVGEGMKRDRDYTIDPKKLEEALCQP